MSEVTNTDYQKRKILQSWAFMTFAKEFGTQINTGVVPKKDGDTFDCAAFSKRGEDGELKTTLVDFTKNSGVSTIQEMVKERDNLNIIALDYSDEEHPHRIIYKLCKKMMKLKDDTIDLNNL